MLSYLQGHTRHDISMPVHQTAHFCNDLKLSHKQAITRIGRYLLGSRDKAIKYKVDLTLKILNASLMLTSLEGGIRMTLTMQATSSQDQNLSLNMLTARYIGQANYRLRLR